MNNWGLTKNGFYRPNQSEIKKVLDERSREEFGANVNLNYKSPNGILNGIFSWFYAILWEVTEKVYHSSHPSEAEGTSLDYLTIFFGTSRRRPQYAEGVLKFTGTPNYTIPFGRIFETEDKVKYFLLADVKLAANGVGYGDISALNTGVSGNCEPNSITVQVEPDSDVNSVTNESRLEGGAEEESDIELRKRLSNSYSALGSGTINAIYADLLEVPGVRAVRIKVNEQGVPVDGLPAHSVAVYTYGGDDNEIADALMENYVGIQFFGTTIVPTKDISGNSHNIGFSKAAISPVKFNITVQKNNTFPSNGVDEIKDAIVSVVGGIDSKGNASNGLNMGDDVVYARIINAVMNVQGVTNTQVLMAKTADTLESKDIVIDDMEVANVHLSDIEVNIT